MEMKKAYYKDIWYSIWRGKKRFISIALIAALGVALFTGLKAACQDLKISADRFFDQQGLYDISVMSTLGLTQDDVDAISAMDGVEKAEGAYSEDVYVQEGSTSTTALLKTLSWTGMNEPYVLEGTIPEEENQVAVTEKYSRDSGKSVGDTIHLTSSDNADGGALKEGDYEITAVVTDCTDINSPEGAVSFRSTTSEDYVFFVVPKAVDSDLYTAVYLTLEGSRQLLCYSGEYETGVSDFIDKIEEGIKDARQQARTDQVKEEALTELADAENEANEKLADGEAQLKDARAQWEDGSQQLAEGEEELKNQEQVLNDTFARARKELEEGLSAIADGQEQLAGAKEQLNAGREELEAGKKALEEQKAETEKEIIQAQALLAQQKQTAQDGLAQAAGRLETIQGAFGVLWPQEEWEKYTNGIAEIYLDVFLAQSQEPNEEQSLLLEQLKEQFRQVLEPVTEALGPQGQALLESLITLGEAMGKGNASLTVISGQEEALAGQKAQAEEQFKKAGEELSQKEEELNAGWESLLAQETSLLENKRQLEEGAALLDEQEAEAKASLAQGREELEESRKTLEESYEELVQGEAEFEKEKEDALSELAEAREEIEALEPAQWYIQDRSALSGYSNIENDTASIEALGTAFPVIFLVVAILISLTAITRMVEEERGLIGTYKALGFKNGEIRRKYFLYALGSCLFGGLIGNLCGFIVLPEIIFIIFRVMYTLPSYSLTFDPIYGAVGIGIFIVGIVGAAMAACRVELKQTPAVLMRPKTPKAGSRVFLEFLPGLWRHLSFLNKVTARNLFRYKKRLFMTVFGIAGCTALVLCGFAIKDTVTDLMPKQYEQVYQYDLMAVSSQEDMDTLRSYLSQDTMIADYVEVTVDSIKIEKEGTKESVQLYAFPDGDSVKDYIQLKNTDGSQAALPEEGILVTQSAARILGIQSGDRVLLQNLELVEKEVTVVGIVKNYLGNNVYMTQSFYQELFGSEGPNGVLAHYSSECENQMEQADSLGEKEGVLSVTSTERLKEEFSTAFALINLVVYVIIFMAAGLALAVLYTLSATNISERMRELATIKVLGFYDREIHSYVNKETVILSIIGIVLGLPAGSFFGHCLTYMLNIPSIHFEVSIHPVSFGIASVISLVFTLAVNQLTNRTLNRINMIEALKSVE